MKKEDVSKEKSSFSFKWGVILALQTPFRGYLGCKRGRVELEVA